MALSALRELRGQEVQTEGQGISPKGQEMSSEEEGGAGQGNALLLIHC